MFLGPNPDDGFSLSERAPDLTESASASSPTEHDNFAALSQGLSLAGQPLEPPRMHETGWRRGQRFSARDDPDRTQLQWDPPGFLQLRDPAEQRAKTSSEDFKIDRVYGVAGVAGQSFARVVHGVLDEEDCAALIAGVNEKGFTPALINTGGGHQVLMPDARDGHRVIVDWPSLSGWLLEVLRPYFPEKFQGRVLVDLNERCRFLCYTPGQYFAPHHDGCYTRPAGHKNAGDSSAITLQLYLHDVAENSGGGTTFLDGNDRPVATCQPSAGDVLIFSQDLYHEGSILKDGLKYTMRTEAMYRRPALWCKYR